MNQPITIQTFFSLQINSRLKAKLKYDTDSAIDDDLLNRYSDLKLKCQFDGKVLF